VLLLFVCSVVQLFIFFSIEHFFQLKKNNVLLVGLIQKV